MATEIRSPQLHSSDATGLLTFLKYNIPAATTGAILLLSLAAYFQHIGLLIMGLVLLGNLAWQLLMWRQAKRNRVEQAASAICAGIAITSSFVAFLIFIAFPIAPLLFVFAIMVALPYVSRQMLLRLIIAATLLSTVVIPSVLLLDISGLTPFPLDDVTPDWLVTVILIIGLPVIIGLIYLLVWQYGIRLEDTLTESQAANQALRVSEQELEAKVQELQSSRARIVAVQEGVRREIASHLHGRVQGRLLVLRGRASGSPLPLLFPSTGPNHALRGPQRPKTALGRRGSISTRPHADILTHRSTVDRYIEYVSAEFLFRNFAYQIEAHYCIPAIIDPKISRKPDQEPE